MRRLSEVSRGDEVITVVRDVWWFLWSSKR
jgi:hypothetical protein